jgi:hypothetical protein
MNLFDVYKQEYSLLPNLKKLGNEPIFLKSDTFEYLEEKKKAIKKYQCFFEHKINKEIYEVICEFISNQTEVKKSTFEKMAMSLQEDIAVHRLEEGEDWMAACHVCFPSGWDPKDKIGKSFLEIHKPIPKFNLSNSYSLARSMVFNGPFVRYVWGISFERQIAKHPSIKYENFNINNPRIWIKIERQITYGFEDIKSALFVIRQEIIEPEDIDYKSFYNTISNMAKEHLEYKGINKDCFDYIYKMSQK